MKGRHQCPQCGGRDVHRAVTTYEYPWPHGAGSQVCRRTDTLYCPRCTHTWDEPAAAGDESKSATSQVPVWR
jgi:predicted RNA-binding Zn-ribbon protein involved in translation (DUF1610 family)